MASSDTRPTTRPSRVWGALGLALALAACHDGSDEARCAEGTDGCLCAADGACGSGLVCEGGRCVAGAPDASSFDAGPDGPPDAVVVEVESGDVARDVGPDTPDLPCSGDPVADFCGCRENADCASGFCLPSSAGGRVCSRTCSGTCPDGFDCLFVTLPGLDPTYLCVEPDLNLCRPCTDDAECQRDAFGASGARCVRHSDGAGSFCGIACREDLDCPASYACREVEALETGGLVRQCVPADAGASCGCSGRSIEDAAFTACALGDCAGTRRCEASGLSPCSDPDGTVCEPAAPVTVTFDPQGGTLSGDASRTVRVGEPYGALPEVSREGHDAAGWRTAPAGQGDLVTAETLVANAAPHTLFASWTPRRYVVRFDAAGGGACEPRTVTFGAAYGAEGPLCAPVREGFRFAGWWTEAGGEVTAATIVAIASDHQLIARWDLAVSGVSGVRLHLPGVAVRVQRPGATGILGSAGHGGPTGRASNRIHSIHFGFHPGLPR